MWLSRPAAGGESCKQDSFFPYGKKFNSLITYVSRIEPYRFYLFAAGIFSRVIL